MSDNMALADKMQLTITNIANTTSETIKKYEKEGKLQLPKNYSASNAIKQMQLRILDDSNLFNCTQVSIANMLMDMCILGLNPVKSQCYPIAYGNKARLFISYFGRELIAKRIDRTIEKIYARPIKNGEIFEFENLPDGNYKIIKHQQTLESMDSKDYAGGYATIIYNDGKPDFSLIMTWERIKKSWKMSKVKPIDDKGQVRPESTHGKFTEDMICRTLINAITKKIINSSDDTDLFSSTAQNVFIENDIADADEYAEENTGEGEFIDIDCEEVEED